MSTKIALLRGINVGGKRKILMADLKQLCEGLGFTHVQTYIQSGNIIFKSDEINTLLSTELEQAIVESFGFDVPVIIRDAEELSYATLNNPFLDGDTDLSKLHLTFLKEEPNLENKQATEAFKFEPDQFSIIGKDVFIYCDGKYHQSKLSNSFFEKMLKQQTTTRNWKTVLKLTELAKEL